MALGSPGPGWGGTGGFFGASLRYAVSGGVHRFAAPTFPWGTLVVNAAGCLLIEFADEAIGDGLATVESVEIRIHRSEGPKAWSRRRRRGAPPECRLGPRLGTEPYES